MKMRKEGNNEKKLFIWEIFKSIKLVGILNTPSSPHSSRRSLLYRLVTANTILLFHLALNAGE